MTHAERARKVLGQCDDVAMGINSCARERRRRGGADKPPSEDCSRWHWQDCPLSHQDEVAAEFQAVAAAERERIAEWLDALPREGLGALHAGEMAERIRKLGDEP